MSFRNPIRTVLVTLLLACAFSFAQTGMRIKAFSGDVKVQLRGNPEPFTLKVGAIVPPDSVIRTGADASVDLRLADGTAFAIGPNSQLRCDNLSSTEEKDTGVFGVVYGKILASFTKSRKTRDFSFATPGAVAGVRGTAFGIDVARDGGSSKVLVTEGTVAYGDRSVPAGQTVDATRGADGAYAVAEPRAFTPAEVKSMEAGVPGGFTALAENPAPAPAAKPAASPAPVAAAAPEKAPPAAPEAPVKPFGLGLGVGMVTLDGKTYTRLSLAPEFAISKFGLGMDIELFIDDKGKLTNRGWDFGTVDAAVESILRKITYVRWSQKDNVIFGNEYFYARLGKLENVTMGNGLIMKGYHNAMSFPAEKNLGLDLALGNVTPLKISLEGMINHLGDLSRGGFITGGRLSFRPFGFSKVPVLNLLTIGGTYVADLNQFGGLRDSDGDGVPDLIDRFPNDSRYSKDTDKDGIPDDTDPDLDGNGTPEYLRNSSGGTISSADRATISNTLASVGVNNGVDYAAQSETLQNVKGKYDYFGMWGVDLVIPFSPNFRLYAQFAMNHDPLQAGIDTNSATGWGISGPGIDWKIGEVLSLNAEYRHSEGAFQPEYFAKIYDSQRARLAPDGKSFVTRDNALTNYTANGFYAAMNLNLYVIYVNLTWEQLFSATGASRGNVEARAYLNRDLLKKVPILDKYIGGFEAYFMKQRVDSVLTLFELNDSMSCGYNLGIKLGGPIEFQNRYRVVWRYDAAGKLVVDDSMFVGMETRL